MGGVHQQLEYGGEVIKSISTKFLWGSKYESSAMNQRQSKVGSKPFADSVKLDYGDQSCIRHGFTLRELLAIF